MGGSPELPGRFFDSPEEFGAWLALHHDTETVLWMGLKKKGVADRGLTWEQAVVEALCWGWIDQSRTHRQRVQAAALDPSQEDFPLEPGQSQSCREAARRGADAAERVGDLGAAHPRRGALQSRATLGRTAGLDAEELAASPAATAFWEASTATYRKVCAVWVTSAQQDVTRARRMAQLIECSAEGERAEPTRRRRSAVVGAGRGCRGRSTMT